MASVGGGGGAGGVGDLPAAALAGNPAHSNKRPRLGIEPVYVVGVARTPLGAFMGRLASLTATDLGAVAIQSAVQRSGVPPAAVGEVYMGNVRRSCRCSVQLPVGGGRDGAGSIHTP